MADAERATKAANEAEGKRAVLEKNLADVETKISKAQEKYDKERNAAQEKALDTLRRRADRATIQFHPSQLAGSDYGNDASIGSSALASQLPRACDVFLSHAVKTRTRLLAH